MIPSPASAADADVFAVHFDQLVPVILEEWPGLDADALRATQGQLDAVVGLVADHSAHTRAWTRRQLGELVELVRTAATPRPRSRPGHRPTPRPERPPPRDPEPSPVEPLDRLVRNLEEHLDDMARQVKQDVAPLAVDTAREHLGLALLLAGGLGLMIGLFLGALGYPQEVTDGEE